jgi:hypothetical protein
MALAANSPPNAADLTVSGANLVSKSVQFWTILGESTSQSGTLLDPADASRSRGAIVVGFVVLMVSGESTSGRVELVAEGRPMLRIKNVGIGDFPKSERLQLS